MSQDDQLDVQRMCMEDDEKYEAKVQPTEAEARAEVAEVMAAKKRVLAAKAYELYLQKQFYAEKLLELERRINDMSLKEKERNDAKEELDKAKEEGPPPFEDAKILVETEQHKHKELSKALEESGIFTTFVPGSVMRTHTRFKIIECPACKAVNRFAGPVFLRCANCSQDLRE